MRLKTTAILCALFASGLPLAVIAQTTTDTNRLFVPTASPLSNKTLGLIKNLETLDTIDTLLTPINKESLITPSDNCPKPPAPPKKNLMSIITPKKNVSLKNINHESGFEPDYIPDDLVDISLSVKTLNNATICLSYPAAVQLVAMKYDMSKEGLSISVNSGFRSYYAQQKLYQNYAPVAKNMKYPRVARAGHSEHQSGLALDIASELNPGRFALSKESEWIKNNAHKYGFIISYPENQEEKTGFMYEPWHLRYVGVENAMLLHEANYTLAYKPQYYKTSSLTQLLSTLKQKFGFAKSVEIGG